MKRPKKTKPALWTTMVKRKKFHAPTRKKELDRLWSIIVRTRDGHCTFCGRTEGKLDANHIMSRRHMATRWNVDNGNSLCFTCHRRFHDDPPWGVAQVLEMIGRDKYDELQGIARNIIKFDEAFYAVKLVELNNAKKLLTPNTDLAHSL